MKYKKGDIESVSRLREMSLSPTSGLPHADHFRRGPYSQTNASPSDMNVRASKSNVAPLKDGASVISKSSDEHYPEAVVVSDASLLKSVDGAASPRGRRLSDGSDWTAVSAPSISGGDETAKPPPDAMSFMTLSDDTLTDGAFSDVIYQCLCISMILHDAQYRWFNKGNSNTSARIKPRTQLHVTLKFAPVRRVRVYLKTTRRQLTNQYFISNVFHNAQ